MQYSKQDQNNNPNTLNFADVVHTIETQVNEHSLHGMFFAFIAGILGNIQHPSPSTLEIVVKVAANLSILFGCLIGFITLIVKCKELHTKFFKTDAEEDDAQLTVPRRKRRRAS